MKKSKAVILPEYNDNLIRALLGMKVEEIDIPELQAGEVLIKMVASPCNPSDIAFMRGGYNIVKPLPAVPGFEASGEVVEAAPDVHDMVGKRVSCFSQADADGTWSALFRASANDCIVLKEGMDMQQAACLSINPLTAVGMFSKVEQADTEAFILNAAGGQVPGFMRVLAREKGIGVINIVRKEQQVEDLKKEGEQWVLNSNSEDFELKLKEACSNLNPTLAFDAVAGEQSGQILNAMPEGSELVVYGGLSGEAPGGFDTIGFIFRNKIVSGFNLGDWITEIGKEEFQRLTGEVQDRFISGKFLTDIQGSFRLEDAVKGIRTYIKSMSSGKILFTP